MSNKTALFPGSFDPFTIGHLSIVKRGVTLFDKVIIAVGTNSKKNSLFTLEERLNQIKEACSDLEKVEVVTFTGLTVNYCKEVGANFILRGLRDVKDFEFEKSIALMNKEVEKSVETVFLMTSAQDAAINSSIVREIYINGGDVQQFVPFSLKRKEL